MRKKLINLGLLPSAEVDKFLEGNKAGPLLFLLDNMPIPEVRIGLMAAIIERFYDHAQELKNPKVPLQQLN